MAIWSYNQKVCASCRYWKGERDYCHAGDLYKACSAEGICCCTESKFNGNIMDEGAFCNLWEDADKNKQFCDMVI